MSRTADADSRIEKREGKTMHAKIEFLSNGRAILSAAQVDRIDRAVDFLSDGQSDLRDPLTGDEVEAQIVEGQGALLQE